MEIFRSLQAQLDEKRYESTTKASRYFHQFVIVKDFGPLNDLEKYEPLKCSMGTVCGGDWGLKFLSRRLGSR